jgi:hypothetical protein
LHLFTGHVGRLRFEISEIDSTNFRRIRGTEKALDVIRSGQYGSLTAIGIDRDSNSLLLHLDGRTGCFLPYFMDCTIEGDAERSDRHFSLFDSLVLQTATEYAFCPRPGDFRRVHEELSFIPISFWQANPSSQALSRENYLLALQRIRNKIGKIVPQFYLINYFSNAMYKRCVTRWLPLLDEDDWTTTKMKGHVKIAFKDLMNREKFDKVQQQIRTRMWEEMGIE